MAILLAFWISSEEIKCFSFRKVKSIFYKTARILDYMARIINIGMTGCGRREYPCIYYFIVHTMYNICFVSVFENNLDCPAWTIIDIVDCEKIHLSTLLYNFLSKQQTINTILMLIPNSKTTIFIIIIMNTPRNTLLINQNLLHRLFYNFQTLPNSTQNIFIQDIISNYIIFNKLTQISRCTTDLVKLICGYTDMK
ncbi:hypothetical protein AGLY_015581 [Aphis glycines]|uniref:Uncharacterized protein n=1 Tax=Aphis glycines TaxID=307491 RepID=A0A6G0T154_APHGL|nr:hypothetical protein AGLY_015581 [Aphis glycines]